MTADIILAIAELVLMEGCVFGFFMAILFGIVALISAPIAALVGSIVAWWQADASPEEKKMKVVIASVVTFVILLLMACVWLEYRQATLPP